MMLVLAAPDEEAAPSRASRSELHGLPVWPQAGLSPMAGLAVLAEVAEVAVRAEEAMGAGVRAKRPSVGPGVGCPQVALQALRHDEEELVPGRWSSPVWRGWACPLSGISPMAVLESLVRVGEVAVGEDERPRRRCPGVLGLVGRVAVPSRRSICGDAGRPATALSFRSSRDGRAAELLLGVVDGSLHWRRGGDKVAVARCASACRMSGGVGASALSALSRPRMLGLRLPMQCKARS